MNHESENDGQNKEEENIMASCSLTGKNVKFCLDVQKTSRDYLVGNCGFTKKPGIVTRIMCRNICKNILEMRRCCVVEVKKLKK